MRIDRAGWPFITGPLAPAAVLAVTGRRRIRLLAWPFVLLSAYMALFFRDPDRRCDTTPPPPDDVLSPADGVVMVAGEPQPGVAPEGAWQQVSVFLSVLDVHVQRIPADGRVVDVQYRQGRFLSADLDKASDDNERNALLLETAGGARVGIVQIAGLLARRIRCDVGPGDEVAAGETYGLIRFGSRVDTYLPAGSTVTVEVGQRTIGGETVLAELPGGSAPGVA